MIALNNVTYFGHQTSILFLHLVLSYSIIQQTHPASQ